MSASLEVVAVADLHGRLPALPTCDLLVIAGDVCPAESASDQRAWLTETFEPWLRRQSSKEILGVAGNWDFIAAEDRELMRSLSWTYLENENTEILGLRVFGSPLSLPYGVFPFTASEELLAQLWRSIAEDVNLLVIHGPAYGLGDLTAAGTHAGSRSLLKRLDELPQLQALVCGHIHEAAGRGEHGHIRWFNVAIAEQDEPLPTLFDISAT